MANDWLGMTEAARISALATFNEVLSTKAKQEYYLIWYVLDDLLQ